MIREAVKEDLPQIRTILEEVHELHYKKRPDFFKELPKDMDMSHYQTHIDGDNTRLFVAVEDSIVIGYMVLVIKEVNHHPIINNQKILFMEELAILSTYRGRGYGSKLYNKAIDILNKEKATSLQLQVWDFNSNAKEFYQKKGMNIRNYTMDYLC